MTNPRSQKIVTDVLIVGGEAAGRRAALEAQRKGARVLLVSKAPLSHGGVTAAAVGACAVTPNGSALDSPMMHFEDTVLGGRFLSNQHIVHRFTEEAARRLLEIEKYGARFDRAPDGHLMQKPLPGHRQPRSLTVGLRTGAAINAALARALERSTSVDISEGTTVTDLVVEDNRVRGVIAIGPHGESLEIHAGAVVLATGGVHALFGTRAYPAPDLTGDGLAIALRAGATAVDLEFVQFFPTALVWPPKWANLIWVGELRYNCDAWLLNGLGERFMDRHDPEQMELSTRDVISRAIALEIREGRGTPHGGVWMSVQHADAHRVDEFIDAVKDADLFDEDALRADGVDVRRNPLEVAPLVHFHMGGLRVDETTATSVQGLFAAGEVAGGLHGANRIENNALAETQVFGAIAGEHAASYAAAHPTEPGTFPAGTAVTTPAEQGGLAEIQRIVSRHLGVLRHGEDLAEAALQLERIRSKAEDLSSRRSCRSVANAALVGETLVRCALARTESRGAHFRIDYPDQDDDRWMRNLVVNLEGGEVAISSENIIAPHMAITSPGRRTPPA